ncbi:MAG TPA: translation initiation factor IF-3 [Rickettsiales bacterium]|nr:translation initiation factor IF-3 [Rickettsiales bacterium]
MFRINDQIRAKEVRVIDDKGQMHGVISLQKALDMAFEASLDLVEVSPNNNPPVCKIANFGKMRYEMQKKAADAKKKQKVIETKEIKMSINIGKGDFDTKIKQIIKFVENGDKVKVSVRMRGREITHLDLAKKMMADILEKTQEFAKAENNPRLEGMQIVAILVQK